MKNLREVGISTALQKSISKNPLQFWSVKNCLLPRLPEELYAFLLEFRASLAGSEFQHASNEAISVHFVASLLLSC